MTPTTLRTSLAALLADLLGTYWERSVSGGSVSRGPALTVGDPPSTWRATGLEVRIEPAPEFANEPLHNHTAIVTELSVRLVAHGGVAVSKTVTAVTRLSQAFLTSNPSFIPSNETLNIPAQYTLRVRT